jgi:OOP family OmpA-OmpF porin
MRINKTFFHLIASCAAPAGKAGVVAFALAGSAYAADPFHSDQPGGADHPLLSRYQGSMLYRYGEEPVGAGQVVIAGKGKPALQAQEGRISSRLYWGPAGRSPVEVFRNYQQALKDAGFEFLYACETVKCEADKVQPLIQNLPRTAQWVKKDSLTESTFNSGSQPNFHYLSARKAGPGGVTYVTLALAGGALGPPVAGRVRQFVQVIAPVQVDMGKVTVDANAIQGGLKRDGKIALYDVTFDTNKATLNPQSDAQLGQMAQALKAAPDLKVFIVGHTDNQGELQRNITLSQQRAEAVVAALGSRFGIAPARMLGRGVANLAPVASNDSEQGRARNRRVELVVR